MTVAPVLDLAAPRSASRAGLPLLRPVPVPATEPPFDDELSSGYGGVPLPRYGNPAIAGGIFAVAAPEPSVGAPTRSSPALRVLAGGRSVPPVVLPTDDPTDEEPVALLGVDGTLDTVEDHVEDHVEDLRARRLADLPDPRPLAGQLAQAVVEVLAGDRPVTQLLTWVDERIYTELAALAPRPRSSPVGNRGRTVLIRPQDRPKVRSIHVGRPAAGVAEIAARVQVNGRSRAVALRLEEWRGRWRCSALIVG